MPGWTGKILRVDLSRGRSAIQEYGGDIARDFIGGRGLAVKLLWDELEAGVDPLSPENELVFAAGPLTGLPSPSAGKLVVESRSTCT